MRIRLLTSVLVIAALAIAAPARGGEPAILRFAQAAAPDTAPVARYSVVQIVQPKSDDTIHDNTGKVPVEVTLQPPLNTRAGHRLQVVLDGTLLTGTWSTTRFSLQQVDRGTHQLEVVVTDRAGKELARSATIGFHVWQASRLFRQRSTP